MSNNKFHSEIFPAILNQYLLKFKAEQRLQFRANILLLVAGVYGVAFFSGNLLSQSKLQIITLCPLIIIYAYSIYFVSQPPSLWPWVSKEKFLELEHNSNSEQIYRSLINQMFLLTGELDTFLKMTLKYIWRSIYLLILTTVWTLTITIFQYDYFIMSAILAGSAIIIGLSIWLYYDFRKKKVVEKLKKMNE